MARGEPPGSVRGGDADGRPAGPPNRHGSEPGRQTRRMGVVGAPPLIFEEPRFRLRVWGPGGALHVPVAQPRGQ